MFALILRGKLSFEGATEDVLTAAALAPIAYGPTDVRAAFLERIAGIDADPDLELTFWPWHPLPQGEGAEPDAFVSGVRTALVIEAKAGSPLTRVQLEREGLAARRIVGSRPLALLTISDDGRRPTAFDGLLADAGGPYDRVRHVSWAKLYEFLESILRRTTEPGYGRLVRDAIAVLDRLERRPYRGVPMIELRRIAPGLDALGSLADEVAILHRGLAAALQPLGLAGPARENVVRMDGMGRSLGQPDTWVPNHIMLTYGAPDRGASADFYFVRVLLRQPAVWIGLSVDAQRLRLASRAPALDADLTVEPARDGLDVAGVEWTSARPNRLRVAVSPLPATTESVDLVLATPSAQRLELVRVHPGSILSGPPGAGRVQRELLALIRMARSVEGLGAP